jgi:hypothetical protein
MPPPDSSSLTKCVSVSKSFLTEMSVISLCTERLFYINVSGLDLASSGLGLGLDVTGLANIIA